MDAADIASANEQVLLEATVAAESAQRGPRALLTADGKMSKCLFCSDALPLGLRWCDPGCRDSWEKEEAARTRNGQRAA
jgi:molybdenum cofactor biosynthesis enzyme MoaA